MTSFPKPAPLRRLVALKPHLWASYPFPHLRSSPQIPRCVSTMSSDDNESKGSDVHSWRTQLPYLNTEFSNPLYHSRCHCGRVKFSVNTAPLDAKLCHCKDCRVMHGAPIQHAAIFEKKAVQFEEGSLDHVRFYANERGSNRGKEGEEGHGKVIALAFYLWFGFGTDCVEIRSLLGVVLAGMVEINADG